MCYDHQQQDVSEFFQQYLDKRAKEEKDFLSIFQKANPAVPTLKEKMKAMQEFKNAGF